MQPTTQRIGTENHPEIKPGGFLFLFCHVCPMKSGEKTIPEIWLGRMFLGREKPTWEKKLYTDFFGAKNFPYKFISASKMLVVWLRRFHIPSCPWSLEFSSMVFGCLGEDGWYVDGLEIRPLHRLRWRLLPVFYRVSLISQVVNAGFLKHQQYLLDSKMFEYHFS